MRIVIDMQGAQTESRFRGIGRYTLALAQAIVRNRGDHEIILALSGLFPNTIEPIRAAFDGLLPQENIRVWYAPGPVRECVPGNEWRREAAELIREAFLTSLQPDIVHITSLFEGYEDDSVTSIGFFDQTIRVSTTLYDLIPLMNPDHYLKPTPVYEKYYLRKIDHLKRSSLLLAISDFSRSEGMDRLGLNAKSIVNISTAVDEHFRPLMLTEEQENALRGKFGLTRSCVLYTGGDDKRKNLPRLVCSYAGLPAELRNKYQLVFAGKMHSASIDHLRQEAMAVGLRQDELVFTGYVTEDELVQLYNLCKLYVFPSWHEGFGLPALEAMACGAPVICASTSSLPEVIENQIALFDPFSVDAIRGKIEQALTDETFRSELIAHGLKQAQKFSWDESGQRALAAFERCNAESNMAQSIESRPTHRPKLAFVSPLPPERTGIADYSAELLPELIRHYDIDVITVQDSVSDSWINTNCQIRDAEWLRSHKNYYDRVLYHFGNSPFHVHMFALLDELPGTVVLHDFFLGHVQAYREESGLLSGSWSRELCHAHGYAAVQERYLEQDVAAVKMKYPTNLSVLQKASGIIVHSETSRRLVKQWYGSEEADNLSLIPLLRIPAPESDRGKARCALNLCADDFIICSFGFLNPTKLNHKLLNAWLNSSLAGNEKCTLVFVGESHDSDYVQGLLNTIRRSGLAKRISITGWVDLATFRKYLAAADMAVQLRTLSRGETSAAVLDCMNYALPTIVNANGSMFDLPDDGVWKIPDEFTEEQMIAALEILWRDASLRQKLGTRAREIIATQHAPAVCADLYFEAIEQFNVHSKSCTSSLIQAVVSLGRHQPDEFECMKLAQTLARNFPDRQPTKQLLLDVSATSRTDLKTGIQRVARALMLELIKAPPAGYRIEPVYLCDTGGFWHYRYARTYTLDLLGCPTNLMADEPIDVRTGDIVICLDLFGEVLGDAQPYLDELHRDGVSINFLVFDLLPVLLPQAFPPGTDEVHANWLRIISRYDGAICISKTVAEELVEWNKKLQSASHRRLKVSWFHLGADIENSSPSIGLPNNAEAVLEKIKRFNSFLMVGTIEPRKKHSQALAAFEELWANNVEVCLVIVGKEGWMLDTLIKKLRKHPELGKRLFWLESTSDEYLEKVYAASTCLVAASVGEGFGLPLIEAAQHKLPIIARDIPVFREVAGEHAYYFNGVEPGDLAEAITSWLTLYKCKKYPTSDGMPWLTWKQSAENLIDEIMHTSVESL